MSHDIHDILRRLAAVTDGPAHHDRLVEDLSAQQRSVKQLPALFKPPQTSPQLSGPYPGQNATRGYLVGEDEEEIKRIEITFTPDDIEVVERAGKLVPDAKILPHIVTQYEKTVGIDREGDAKLKLDLSSNDLSAIRYIIEKYGRKLDETGIFYHMIDELERQQSMTEAATTEEIAEGDVVAFSRAGMTTVKDRADYIDKRDKIFRLLSQPGTDAQTRAAAKAQLKTLELAARNAGIMTEESGGEHRASLAETMAEIEEDMLSRVKKDLNAYLDRLGEKISDDGRRDRDTPQLDKLARKQRIDRELLLKAVDAIEKRKAEESLDENDYELSEPETVHAVQDKIDTVAGQPQKPIQVMEIAPGKVFEVYQMSECDYEIRHGGRPMKSRFGSASDADVALKLFKAHHDRKQRDSSADYIPER